MIVFIAGIALMIIAYAYLGDDQMNRKDICIMATAAALLGVFGWGYNNLDNKIDQINGDRVVKLEGRVAVLEARVHGIAMAATDGKITAKEAENIGTEAADMTTGATPAIQSIP